MNKSKQIAFYKKQLDSSRTMKAAGHQIIAQATLLESEANSALVLLGTKPERSRKGIAILSEETKFKLLGSLTK